jgi:hypothetical protein
MTRKELRANIIDEFYKSGLSKINFCKLNKISKATLYNWMSAAGCNFKKNNIPCKTFIPIEVKQEKTPVVSTDNIIIKTSQGHTIKIPLSFSSEKISCFLKAFL